MQDCNDQYDFKSVLYVDTYIPKQSRLPVDMYWSIIQYVQNLKEKDLKMKISVMATHYHFL